MRIQISTTSSVTVKCALDYVILSELILEIFVNILIIDDNKQAFSLKFRDWVFKKYIVFRRALSPSGVRAN
jgi:hypothetical protein